MSRIEKIYSSSLDENQCDSFSFTSKGYKKVQGLLLFGQAAISLVFNKENHVFAHNIDVEVNKDIEPNKRVFSVDKDIGHDFIKGSVSKTVDEGKVSIYLIME